MLVEIKSSGTDVVLFSCEAKNKREAVEKAVSKGACLRGANMVTADLTGVDLSDVDLRGADLRGADLMGADLTRVNLRGANLNAADLRGATLYDEILAIPPISILNLEWDILISERYLVIGCLRRTHEEWRTYGADKITILSPRAVAFWEANKIWISAACDAHKSESLKSREKESC